jgi:hypothetical protein
MNMISKHMIFYTEIHTNVVTSNSVGDDTRYQHFNTHFALSFRGDFCPLVFASSTRRIA